MEKKNFFKNKNWIEAAGLLIIIAGLITSIRMNLVGRSLWWDEAALAYSFSLRGLSDLTSEGLELLQSAPVGWLYTQKIITLIFGNTDFVLRLFSIAAYVGILWMVYLILSRVFCVRYPVTATSFAASFPLLLQYSNMFKPYISDGFFCLLTVWLFYCREQKKIKPLTLGILWAVLVWFSNPVCFVAGGLLLAEGIFSMRENSLRRGNCPLREKIADWCRIAGPLGISFVAYYFYWLRQTATDERMIGYWEDWNFPLFPTTAEDFDQIKKLFETLFSPFYRLEYAVVILLAVFFVYQFYKKSRIFTGIYLSFLVALLASGLNMFPVNKRLWLFIYPLIIILVTVGLDRLSSGIPLILGLIMLSGALLNGGIRYYWNEENVYWPGYEVKKEYEYLKEIITPEEQVYVFSSQAPIFNYYNHYNFHELEDIGCTVMVGEDPLNPEFDCQEDLNYIIGSQKCYVVLGDTWDKKYYTGLLFSTLHEAGYFEMVYNEYETPLWYFCQDIKDVKTKVSLRAEEADEEGNSRIILENTGESWLNPKFETLELVSEDGNLRLTLPKNIAPGEKVELETALPEGSEVRFHLENEYGIIAEQTDVTVAGPQT